MTQAPPLITALPDEDEDDFADIYGAEFEEDGEKVNDVRVLSSDDADFVHEVVTKILQFADELSGKPLFPYQRDFAYRVVESVVLNDGEQITALFSRQCLDGDTVVFRRDGTAVRLREHESAFKTGTKPTKRYLMRGGAEVVMTDNHPVYTPDGWTAAGLLRPGNRVAILLDVPTWRGDEYVVKDITFSRWKTPHTVREAVDVPLARLLGYFATDGSHRPDQSAKFTSISELYLSEFSDLLEKRFGQIPLRYTKGNGYDLLITTRGQRAGDNPFRDLLRALDWDHGFPLDVFGWDYETASEFINRAWAGDGCITMKGSGPDIFLACGNDEVYARYWQALLLKFGVLSTVKRERMAKGTGTFHRLVIGSGALNVRRFFAATGLVYGKEDASAAALDYFDAKSLRASGKGRAERVVYQVAGHGIDQEVLGWSTVLSITDAGVRDVYDMEVSGKGWFVAQGLQVSNSGKTETIAQVVGALMVLLPKLAVLFPEWFSTYKDGFMVGTFAPVESQAETLYQRVVLVLSSEAAKELLEDPEIDDIALAGGKLLRLRNSGSLCRMQTANPKAQIESKSYHLIVIDESQRAVTQMVRQSIEPMGAFYNATVVKTGTPFTSKGDFYEVIQHNKRQALRRGGVRNHFEHDWRSCARYNPKYRQHVKRTMNRIGEDSDEFQLSYALKWLLERGMFTTTARLEELGDKTMQSVVREWYRTPIIVGIDPARKQDSTVLTALMVDWDYPDEFGYYDHRVLNWLEIHGDDWEVQYGQMVDFINHYAVWAVAIDAQGVGDVVADRLTRLLPASIEVHPVMSNVNDQSARWKHLMELMGRGRIGWPAGAKVARTKTYQRFIQQMADLEKVYGPGGHMLAAAPKEAEAHDDYPDSLALACWLTKDSIMPTAETSENPFYSGSRPR